MNTELEEWHYYGAKAEHHMAGLEADRSLLDTKQSVLRMSLFGIVGLGFFMCLFAFQAPSLTSQPGAGVSPEAFFTHLLYLQGAFCSLGGILGVAVFRVKATTDGSHAFRCGLISAATLSVSSFLVALPYVYSRMWGQSITAGTITMPMLVWMAIFRVFFAPVVAAACSRIGFSISSWIAHGRGKQ